MVSFSIEPQIVRFESMKKYSRRATQLLNRERLGVSGSNGGQTEVEKIRIGSIF